MLAVFGLRTQLILSCRAAPRLSECPKKKETLWEDGERGSDTYTRVAGRVTSNLQRLVIRALIEQPNADPPAEEETIIQFESSLCEKGVAPADRLGCPIRLERFRSHDSCALWKEVDSGPRHHSR